MCGVGHLERVFGAVGRGHTMGFEAKCRLREVSSFWVRRVWNWVFLFFVWFSVGCDNVLRLGSVCYSRLAIVEQRSEHRNLRMMCGYRVCSSNLRC